MADFPFASLKTALRALRKKEVSSVELVAQVLERIEALNPRLGALSGVLAERARAEALAVDRRRAAGKIPGVAGRGTSRHKGYHRYHPRSLFSGLAFPAGLSAGQRRPRSCQAAPGWSCNRGGYGHRSGRLWSSDA